MPDVENGVADPVAGETGDYDTTYSVTCNTGYKLTDDVAESGTCATDEAFGGDVPACESKILIQSAVFVVLHILPNGT